MKQETDQSIIKYSKELRMPVFRSEFKSLAKQAAIDNIGYEEFLLQLMQREFEARVENRKKSQIFTSVHRLLTQLRESHSERTLRQLEIKFEKYDLVICDEFGYVSFDKEGAELLFNHLSLRVGRKSTIITTNLGFDRWEEIFGDAVLTAALVDRLTHKAFLINMNGESYRLKETKQMMKK